MSQDMALFGTSNLPAYLQGHVSATTAALKGNSSEGDRISIRGRVWRLIQDGQEVAASAAPEMDLIVVAALPSVSRSYFDKEFVEGESTVPTCWSTDGVTPDVNVTSPCANACAACPKDQPGSGNRDQSRACRFSKRIAVALPSDTTRAYLMQIPATSLFGDKVADDQPKSLQQYGRFLAARNADITTLLTRFQFDISSTQPTIRFSAHRYLTQEEFAGVCQLMRDPHTMEMLALSYPSSGTEVIPGTPPSAPVMVAQVQVPQTAVPQTAVPQTAVPQTAAFAAPTEKPARAARGSKKPPVQAAGFGAPVTPGFGAPTAAPQASMAPTPIAEPTVMTAGQGAANAGVATGDVADLLASWGA